MNLNLHVNIFNFSKILAKRSPPKSPWNLWRTLKFNWVSDSQRGSWTPETLFVVILPERTTNRCHDGNVQRETEIERRLWAVEKSDRTTTVTGTHLVGILFPGRAEHVLHLGGVSRLDTRRADGRASGERTCATRAVPGLESVTGDGQQRCSVRSFGMFERNGVECENRTNNDR